MTDSATANRIGRSLDPVASLAWVAGRVEGIGIGTSIVPASMHHPFHVAREAGTLQLLSGGRFNLSIGVCWSEAELRLAGYGFLDRDDRADEALRVVEALWAGETSFHGEFWSFDDAFYYPRPEPPPPIWIGSNSARALARARRHGAVWHPNGLPEEQFAPLKDGLDGRIVPRVPIVFDRELDDWYTVSGSEQAIAERLDQALTAGADGFLLSFAGGTAALPTCSALRPRSSRGSRERRNPKRTDADSGGRDRRRARRRGSTVTGGDSGIRGATARRVGDPRARGSRCRASPRGRNRASAC